jgi:glycosyltransferase involved in cell wall biosynthesis
MIFNVFKNCVRAVHKQIRRVLHQDIVSLTSDKAIEKTVLLSYVTFPFRCQPEDLTFFSHTSTFECLQIAKTWLCHGYNVDVIDWDNTWFLPGKDYSIFIDIHSNMERISPFLRKDCKKILHITGAHWRFQNEAEMKRLSDLNKRKKILIKPRRQVAPSQGIEFADCATILGNAFTRGTFAYSNKPLYPIPLSTTIQYPFMEKNFQKIRKNFLWLGSSGMVHKGLDLVLDVFAGLPDYHLTICGPVNEEPDFEKAYYKELYQSENIRTIGAIDIRSTQFLEIVQNTSALIYPSCSEGQAGSVITCMHAGLIPIISYESGVDIDNFGILLKDCSIDEIRASVIALSQKSDIELRDMAKRAWQYAQDNHTQEKFAQRYDRFVTEISPL